MTAAAGEASGTTVLQRMASKVPYLPTALRQVAEYILAKPEASQAMSITALADEVGVAESTVSRFVREMGLEGYQALRLAIAEATFRTRAQTHPVEQGYVYEGISRDDATADIIGKIERSSVQSLRQSALRLNVEAVESAVQLIERAPVLVFCCMGSSSIAAEDAVMRFTRAGKKCLLFRDQSIQAMLATIVGSGDVVVGISDSGRSTVINEAMRQARLHGAATIGITSTEGTPFVEYSDVSLFTSTLPSGGALYGESVTSKWGQTLVIDVLYAAFAAQHYDRTLAHLEETYTAAIEHSRS